MIEAKVGDLTQCESVDYICNAANAQGPMGGGVAKAIREAGGNSIEKEAKQQCNELKPIPGDIYITKAGALPVKGIIHLVTMEQPAEASNYDSVRRCLATLLDFCEEEGVNSVALPALGTGVGGLDVEEVAGIVQEELAGSSVTFQVIDVDESFIKQFNREV
ncbi:macro domain-containing protein [Salsuginibacillus kocurii]|uniref:macro domain-containing protein n=1 Tax=Salsuginibacillus kocurii TaxID=427078 RepID=UPI000362E932|nr:macro domain-containing protein [Salsuginibacillus kocurii]